MLDSTMVGRGRWHHRNLVLSILLFMVLINIAIRYPLSHAVPHGSDSIFILDLARFLETDASAEWILSPMSYFGLYPLSYPSGAPFFCADFHIASGISWNALPCVVGMMLGALTVLASFVLLRTFHIRSELAAILAGLVALTPLLVRFTFQQTSSRGFVVPFFILGLAMILWQTQDPRRRLILFVLFSACMLTIHRTSFFVLIVESVAYTTVFLSSWLPVGAHKLKRAAYLSAIALGAMMIFWPYIPGLKVIFGSISEFSVTYEVGQYEFSSGYLLEGNSPFVLVVNLGANYVGSLGLILLLLPLALIALYPRARRVQPVENSFIFVMLILFTPFVWKAQYIQLLMVPTTLVLAGSAIEGRKNISDAAEYVYRRAFRRRTRLVTPRLRATMGRAFVVFLVACFLFSGFMIHHRLNLRHPETGESIWPSESQINTALYMSDLDCDDWTAFVSNIGEVDRHVRWFSLWDSPVIDSTVLQASGYYNATAGDFILAVDASDDFIGFLTTFYKSERFFVLNSSVENKDVYYLTLGGGVYGIVRIYYDDPVTAIFYPKVSTAEARVSIVMVLDAMGTTISNPWAVGETLPNPFLAEIVEATYKTYSNEDYHLYVAADPA